MADVEQAGGMNLHLDVDRAGTEADEAHGLVDVAAAVAEYHWRQSALYARVERIGEAIEADLSAHGVAEDLVPVSDQLTELLCAYDALARQSTRLAFALSHTLTTANASNFTQWLAAADDWLAENGCGPNSHG